MTFVEHDNAEYLRQRAAVEQELAGKAPHPVAARAHAHLASLYQNRLEQIERRTRGVERR